MAPPEDPQDLRGRVFKAIDAFCAEPRDLELALESAGIGIEDLLEQIKSPSVFRRLERSIERSAHMVYLLACAKLAAHCLDSEKPDRQSLEFLAKRFDPAYMPQSSVLHQHQSLPEFEGIKTKQLLQMAKDRVPPWMLSIIRGEERGGTAMVRESSLEPPDGKKPKRA